MSQITTFPFGKAGLPVETLTGNSGGPVGPDGSDNINVVGTGSVSVAGNPATNTLTISSTALTSISITGDSGGALTGSSFTFTGDTTGLTFAGAGTTETLGGTLNVAHGGTGDNTLTLNGVLVGNGTSAVQVTAAGTTGQVLTGNTGSAPTFQALPASSISITGDSGGALTGNSFTFTGGTTGLTFAGAGTTETLGGTLVVSNGGTGRTTLTNHGVLVGAATSAVTQLSVGTNGQCLLGSTGADPAFASLTSTGGSLTYTTGAASLNIDIASYADKTSFTPTLAFGGASTGITYLANTGIYTRLANLIFVQISIALSSVGSATGVATVAGLPFSSSNHSQPLTVIYQTVTYSGQPACLTTNATNIALYNMASAGNLVQLTNTAFSNSSSIIISGVYTI